MSSKLTELFYKTKGISPEEYSKASSVLEKCIKQLQAIEGYEGVYIFGDKDGRAYFKLYIKGRMPEALKEKFKTIEGYKVKIMDSDSLPVFSNATGASSCGGCC